MQYDLDFIESQLQKRLPYRYSWGQKQNNIWDAHTHFIYSTPLWEDLLLKIKTTSEILNIDKGDLFNYASNRWFNFWSAIAIEQVFTRINGIEPVKNKKDFEKDFYLFKKPFDHKTSVFPKGFGKPLTYAIKNPKELITWLYLNQSKQKRYHLKNRLFVVVHAKDGNHWKCKAAISTLKKVIEDYMSNYKEEQLHCITFANNTQAFSDIIWVNK